MFHKFQDFRQALRLQVSPTRPPRDDEDDRPPIRDLSPGKGQHIKFPEFSFSGTAPVQNLEKGQFAAKTEKDLSTVEAKFLRDKVGRSDKDLYQTLQSKQRPAIDAVILMSLASGECFQMSEQLFLPCHVVTRALQSSYYPLEPTFRPAPSVMLAADGRGKTGVTKYDKIADHPWGEEVMIETPCLIFSHAIQVNAAQSGLIFISLSGDVSEVNPGCCCLVIQQVRGISPSPLEPGSSMAQVRGRTQRTRSRNLAGVHILM